MRRRRPPQLELGVLYLLLHIIDIGITHIPIITLFTTIAQTLLYIGFLDVPWDKDDVCISPAAIFLRKDYKVLFLGTFEHATDMHLYYNMVSYIVKGRTLERRYGSANFAFLLIFLTLTSSLIFVSISYVGAIIFQDPTMLVTCAIGFSGVIFALKTVLYKEQPSEVFSSGFMEFSSKYAPWAELIMIHLLVPQASFSGHLGGIIAGLVYTNTFIGKYFDKYVSSITGTRFPHGCSIRR